MGRHCTVCDHELSHLVNVALVSREPYRAVAKQFGLSTSALKRHSAEHIPQLLVTANEAVLHSQADDLIRHMRGLQGKTLKLLEEAEAAGDLGTALRGVREARGNIELLARLRQLIDSQPQTVNLTISSEWLELRTVIVNALESFPEARAALMKALEGVA